MPKSLIFLGQTLEEVFNVLISLARASMQYFKVVEAVILIFREELRTVRFLADL